METSEQQPQRPEDHWLVDIMAEADISMAYCVCNDVGDCWSFDGGGCSLGSDEEYMIWKLNELMVWIDGSQMFNK